MSRYSIAKVADLSEIKDAIASYEKLRQYIEETFDVETDPVEETYMDLEGKRFEDEDYDPLE